MSKPITVTFSDDNKELYQKHAQQNEESLSTFVRRALKMTMAADLGAVGYRHRFDNRNKAAQKAKTAAFLAAAAEEDRQILADAAAKHQPIGETFLEASRGTRSGLELETAKDTGEVLTPVEEQVLYRHMQASRSDSMSSQPV